MSETPTTPEGAEDLKAREAKLEGELASAKEGMAKLNETLAALGKSPAENPSPEPAAKEAAGEVVPEAEWNDFVNNGKVSQARIALIAEKMKTGQPLASKEQAMRTARSEDVETLLKNNGADPATAAGETTPTGAPTKSEAPAMPATTAEEATTESTKAPEKPQEKIDAAKTETQTEIDKIEAEKARRERGKALIEKYKNDELYKDRKDDFETAPKGTAIEIVREKIEEINEKIKKKPEKSDDYKKDIERLENDLRDLGVEEDKIKPAEPVQEEPPTIEEFGEQGREALLAKYVELYNAHYAEDHKGWWNKTTKRGWRNFLYAVGINKQVEDESKWSEELTGAKKAYETARDQHLQENFAKIDKLAALQNWPPEKIAAMKKKYVALEAVKASEASLIEARDKNFKTWLRTLARGYKKAPLWMRITGMGALIGIRIGASGGATVAISAGAALLGSAGMGAFQKLFNKRFVRSAEGQEFIKAYAEGREKQLIEKAKAESDGGVVSPETMNRIKQNAKHFAAQIEQASGNPAEFKKQIIKAYNNGVIPYKVYVQTLEEIERRQRARGTVRTITGVAAAGTARVFADDITAGIHDLFDGKDGAPQVPGGDIDVPGDADTPAEVPGGDADTPEVDDGGAGDVDTPTDEGSAEVPTTPEDSTPAPESYTFGDVDSDAFIQKGEGITHAFQRQLDADPDLVKALESEIGGSYADNKAGFLYRLAQEYGYIDENGADVRVFHGNNAAYDLRLEDGKVVVHEWANGQHFESHGLGSDFEPTTPDGIEKPYEYSQSAATSSPETASADVTDLNQVPDAADGTASIDVTDLNQVPDATDGTASIDVTDLNQTPADTGVDPNSVFAQPDSTQAEVLTDPWAEIKQTGFKMPDGSTVPYENVANGSGRGEVLEGDLSALPQNIADAFIALRSAILDRGIDTSTLPYSLSVDDLTQIAAGASIDQFLNVPDLNALQVADLLDYPSVHPLDAQGMFEFFRVNIGEQLGTYLDMPYTQMETVLGEGAAPDEAHIMLGTFMQKLVGQTDLDLTSTPNASIENVLDRALLSMGSNATVESMLTR